MQVKTFTGTSTQEVIALIKDALGADAIILGSREFRKDGQRLYEITAGIERAPVPPGQAAPKAPVSAPAEGKMPGWDDWNDDWSRIKGHLYSLMRPALQWDRLNPRQRVALDYLQKEGVEDDVLVELYRALVESRPDESMLAALARLVPVRGFGLGNWPERLQILTGPFGVGKTTVALRLGMALRAANPGLSITYLNADCARGNGRLILRHWAELSDFGYFETPDAASMKAALRACQSTDVIFVDLRGLAPGEKLPVCLTEFGLPSSGKGMAVHIAIPPHYASRQLEYFLRCHQTGLPTSVVWTKLDEAVGFGNLVNVAVRSRLPISALSFGSELQSSLVSADEGTVWRLLLKRQIPGQTAFFKRTT